MLEKSAVVVNNEQEKEILRFFEQIDWESLSSQNLALFVDKFADHINFFATPRQINKILQLKGDQSVITNNQNVFLTKDTISKITEGFVNVLATHLGPEATKDLMTEFMKSAIAKF